MEAEMHPNPKGEIRGKIEFLLLSPLKEQIH